MMDIGSERSSVVAHHILLHQGVEHTIAATRNEVARTTAVLQLLMIGGFRGL